MGTALGIGIGIPFQNASGAVDAYLVNDLSPDLVADFAGVLNSDTPYYRQGGATAAFADFLTISRASSATYVDSSGNLQTASSGVARVNHHRWNGSAWVNKGILVESEARTNLETNSVALTGYLANKVGCVVTGGQAGFTGGTNAAVLQANGTGLGYAFGVLLNLAATVTFSVYLKAGTYNSIRIQVGNGGTTNGVYADVNLSAGTIGSANVVGSGFSVVGSPTIEALEDDWYRASITVGAFGTWAAYLLFPASGGHTSSSTILFEGPQVEVGATPSSYIPTSGSTATRAAETLTIAGADMPYSATAMSLHMQGEISYADEGAAAQQTFARWYADANNYIILDLDTDSTATGEVNAEQAASGTVDGVALASNYTAGLNVAFNIASRHTSGAINAAKDGTAGTADETPAALPALGSTAFQLGYDFMGTISLCRAWDADLTDAGIEEAST